FPNPSFAQNENSAPSSPSQFAVVDVKFKFKGKDRSAIDLLSPILPIPLTPSSTDENSFVVPLFFTANRLDIAVMLGSTVVQVEGRRLTLAVSVGAGKNNFLLTVIDSKGKLYEYDLIIDVEDKSDLAN